MAIVPKWNTSFIVLSIKNIITQKLRTMKKMFLTMVAAAAMVLTTQTATAQVEGENKTAPEQEMQQKHDFEKIEVADLPAEVQQAVERDFQGSTVAEAYVKEKDGEKKYKVVLSTTDGQSKELYADAQGNWIEKDKKKDQEQPQE